MYRDDVHHDGRIAFVVVGVVGVVTNAVVVIVIVIVKRRPTDVERNDNFIITASYQCEWLGTVMGYDGNKWIYPQYLSD